MSLVLNIIDTTCTCMSMQKIRKTGISKKMYFILFIIITIITIVVMIIINNDYYCILDYMYKC